MVYRGCSLATIDTMDDELTDSQLDDFTLSLIQEVHNMGHERDAVLLEALGLTEDTFMEFSGACIEKDSNGNHVVACYDKLDWEEEEYDIVIANIGKNELFEGIDTDGRHYTFFFRIPEFHEVCSGLKYFRNVYNLSFLDDYDTDDSDDSDDETEDKKLEEDTANLNVQD